MTQVKDQQLVCAECHQPVAPKYIYCPWCGAYRESGNDAWDRLNIHDDNCRQCRDAIMPESYPALFAKRCAAGERLERIAFEKDEEVGYDE